MGQVEQDIKDALKKLFISKDDFHRLDEHRAHKVLQDVKRHFLVNPDAAKWWEAFRYGNDSRALAGDIRVLTKMCPNEGKKIWLVPCGGESIYDVYPEVAMRVMMRCPGSDFALVDKKLDWMFVYAFGEKKIYASREKAIASLLLQDAQDAEGKDEDWRQDGKGN